MDDLSWRKSSYSGGDTTSTECVEVGFAAEVPVGVRDTKARDAGALRVPAAAWAVFVDALK